MSKKIKCKSCGNLNWPGEEFCSNCNGNLQQSETVTEEDFEFRTLLMTNMGHYLGL